MSHVHRAYSRHGIDGLRRVVTAANANARDALGVPILCDAAVAGDVEAIQFLIDQGADIEASGSDGWTPLIHAANAGREDAIRYLVSEGANVEAESTEGYKARDRVPRARDDLLRLLGG